MKNLRVPIYAGLLLAAANTAALATTTLVAKSVTRVKDSLWTPATPPGAVRIGHGLGFFYALEREVGSEIFCPVFRTGLCRKAAMGWVACPFGGGVPNPAPKALCCAIVRVY